jgi:type IV secretion system protein VirB9
MVLALSSPAWAAEMPKPCGPDPRERCIAYRKGQIVQLYLAPGATMTIELPETETVFFVGTSDDAILRGDGASVRPTGAPEVMGDSNLMTSVPGGAEAPTNFLTLKALHALEPQPLVVIGTFIHPVTGKQAYRRHTFELQTAPLDKKNESFYSLVFSDPESERAMRKAEADARREERDQQAVMERMEQVDLSVLEKNTAYEGQGTDDDRAALAPSAPPGMPAMWDDGQRTFLRYPGNRHVPIAYQVMPGGQAAVIGQTVAPEPSVSGNLLIIEGVLPMLRLRYAGAVLCIINRAYKAAGRNPGTGTVDPGVMRDKRRGADGRY